MGRIHKGAWAGDRAEITGQSLDGQVRKIHDPVFAALALADDQATSGQIEVTDLEVNTLTGPQTGVSQHEKTGIFQADERIRAVQAGLDEGLQALTIAVGQIARQPVRFGQRTEPKNSGIGWHAGVGLLPQGGQDIVQNPVDGGGGDALVGHPLALVSLQVGQAQVGRLAEGAASQVPIPETLDALRPRYLRAWIRWRRGDQLGRRRWT